MKTDLYTKTVLTIIAICLTLNVISEYEVFPSAYASDNTKGTINSPLISLSSLETIDVRIVDINTSDELKVNITSIDTADEIDVNLDEIGGSWISSGGPINVKIKE